MKILCIASLCTLAAVAAADGNCILATIDFSELPNGEELKGGDYYLSNEWYNTYGLSLSATGGLGNKPPLFNTSDIGTHKYGDPDLGSPNECCPNPGPGRGEGGEPGTPGANCEPLGNVLIIQEDNRRPEIPDDNVDGGVITFIFSEPWHIKSIGF